MDSRPLISVVVPVYNVVEYLEECVSSLTNQSFGDIEIILVDDGSTDGSSTMCDDLENPMRESESFIRKTAVFLMPVTRAFDSRQASTCRSLIAMIG